MPVQSVGVAAVVDGLLRGRLCVGVGAPAHGKRRDAVRFAVLVEVADQGRCLGIAGVRGGVAIEEDASA